MSPEIGATFVSRDQFDPTKHQALFIPNPGPQEEALRRTETEILFGGSKGGGKSFLSIIWLVSGNQAFGEFGPPGTVHESYIHHPRYRALVLRKNLVDMTGWIREAAPIYKKLGAKLIVGQRPRFRFPSGAEILVSHMQDKNAWEKYAGWNITRMVIEEATQIPTEELYLMTITACLRTVYPEMRTQVLLTANPGGAGHGWVKRRFVRAYQPNGDPVEEGETIVDADSGDTRVFIRSRLSDNPYLDSNGRYRKMLMNLPKKLRRALLDGDWDVLEGQYFSEFRETRRMDEPEWAYHVMQATEIPAHARRWIGGDWGYNHPSAFYWFARNPKSQRVEVYREWVKSKVGSYRLGVEIAQATLPDLMKMPVKMMPLYIGADVWQKRDEGASPAEQMANGIRRVLGDRGCVLRAAAKEATAGNRAALEVASDSDAPKGRIVIAPAYRDRIAGAAYLHEMLRWEPVMEVNQDDYDPAYAKQLQREDPSGARFREYYGSFFEIEPEVLPKMRIHATCRRLIDRIPAMVHDPSRPEDMLKVDDDDEVDAWRYGAYSHHMSDIELSEEFYIRSEVDKLNNQMRVDPTDWQFIHATLRKNWRERRGAKMTRVSIPPVGKPVDWMVTTQ